MQNKMLPDLDLSAPEGKKNIQLIQVDRCFQVRCVGIYKRKIWDEMQKVIAVPLNGLRMIHKSNL